MSRGLAADDAVAGGEMGSLKGLYRVLASDPVFLAFGI